MVDMVHGFIMGNYLSKQATSTLVVLIAKADRPSGFSNLRPISLGTFASKIISEILASRLVLPRIIDEHQSGFVQGWSIHEPITLAQELDHDIDGKAEG